MKTTSKTIRVVLALAVVLAGAGVINASEPFYEGLGSYKRTITTGSPEAQRYFNQGLAFYHGFNHGAAIRSFQEAARLDPKCAMAHWGIALASGPHINLPIVPPPAAEMAWQELKLAQERAEHASPVERDLIEALSIVTPTRSRRIALRLIRPTRTRCARSGRNTLTIRMSASCLPRR